MDPRLPPAMRYVPTTPIPGAQAPWYGPPLQQMMPPGLPPLQQQQIQPRPAVPQQMGGVFAPAAPAAAPQQMGGLFGGLQNATNVLRDNPNYFGTMAAGFLDKRRNANTSLGDIAARAAVGRSVDSAERERKEEKEEKRKADDATGRYLKKLHPEWSDDDILAIRSNPALLSKAIAGQDVKPLINVGEDSAIYDPNTGQWIERPGGGGPDQEAAQKTESELRKEYTGSPQYKRFDTVHSAFKKVRVSAAIGTGPGDMSLIFGYMKLLDPASTVREGEYATAQQTTGIPGWITNLYNQAKDGQPLNPEQRQQFVDAAQQLYEEEAATMTEFDTRYDTLATDAQVSPDRVTIMNIPTYSQDELLKEARRRGLVP